MKKEINLLRVALIVILVIAIGIGAIFCLGSGKANYDEITEVKITTNVPIVREFKKYSLCFENGEWNAYYMEDFWIDEAQKFDVDEAFANEIISVLEKNQVHKWNSNSLKYRINKKAGDIEEDRGDYLFYIGYANGNETEVDVGYINGAFDVYYEVKEIFISLIGEPETE